MKILVLNCGSSSVKYKLFDIEKGEVMAQGGVEKIGLKDSFLKLTLPNGEKVVLEYDMPEHRSAIRNILNVLTSKEYGCIASYDEIDAVVMAIKHHSDKKRVHDPLSEVLKDADVLDHFLSDPFQSPSVKDYQRYRSLKKELGINLP